MAISTIVKYSQAAFIVKDNSCECVCVYVCMRRVPCMKCKGSIDSHDFPGNKQKLSTDFAAKENKFDLQVEFGYFYGCT